MSNRGKKNRGKPGDHEGVTALLHALRLCVSDREARWLLIQRLQAAQSCLYPDWDAHAREMHAIALVGCMLVGLLDKTEVKG